MKYRALITFSGIISMAQGEIREIDNQEVIADLLRAKFIEPAEEEKNEVGAEAPAPKTKAKKKK